jgi:hypothetical protein
VLGYQLVVDGTTAIGGSWHAADQSSGPRFLYGGPHTVDLFMYATSAAPAVALSWRRHAPLCAAECTSNACSGVRDSAVKCRGCDVHNADPFVEVYCTSECTSGASEASEHGCFPGIPTYGGGCGHCLSGEGECIDYFGHHCASVDAATAVCPQGMHYNAAVTCGAWSLPRRGAATYATRDITHALWPADGPAWSGVQRVGATCDACETPWSFTTFDWVGVLQGNARHTATTTEASLGLGRIVALHHRSSTVYHIL